jgi:hypothetical protein
MATPYYYGSLGAPASTTEIEDLMHPGHMNVYEPRPRPTPKKRISNWVKFGIPIALLVIAGAVVGGIFGSRKSHSSSSSNSPSAAASSAASVKSAIGEFPTATDSFYGVPLYPSTVSLPPFNVFYNNSQDMSFL